MRRTTTTPLTEAEFVTLGEVGEKYGIKPARFVALFNRGEFVSRLFRVGRSFKAWQVLPEEVLEWRRSIERKPGGSTRKKDPSRYLLDPNSATAAPTKPSKEER